MMPTSACETPGGKWSKRYPDLGTGPVSIEPYISAEYFEKEREHIFRKVWLNVGRVEQIPEPGDYFVKDLAVCRTAVVIVRGEDGGIRAFHNMCSHRGNPVVWDGKGTCKMFTCRYHSWTYGLDGRLRNIPDEKNFYGVDKGAYGLTPVSVDTWEGFIFINVDPSPKDTLREYLGEIGESFEGYPFAEMATDCATWEIDVNANWKVCKDAFQEVYHIFSLHNQSTGAAFASKSNPHLNVHELALFGPHARISVPANLEWEPTVVEALAKQYGMLTLQKQGASSKGMPEGVNPTKSRDWSFSGLIYFPNTCLFVADGGIIMHTMWPLSENRTHWEARTYFPKAKTLAHQFSQEYGRATFVDGVLVEDGGTFEKTQSMLDSGAKKEVILGDEELLIRHHHRVTERFFHDHENSG